MVWPPEAIALAIINAVVTGVAGVWGWRKSRVAQTADTEAKAAERVAQDLRDAQQRLIDSAERRETAMAARLERSLDGMGKLTEVLTDNTSVQKLMAERIVEIKTNQDSILQELRYARRQ